MMPLYKSLICIARYGEHWMDFFIGSSTSRDTFLNFVLFLIGREVTLFVSWLRRQNLLRTRPILLPHELRLGERER